MSTTDWLWLFAAIEWAWLVMSLCSTIVNCYGVHQAQQDRQWVIESKTNHGRLAAADRNLRRDTVLAIVSLLFFLVGVSAILSPPTPSQSAPVTQTFIYYLSMIAIQALLTWYSVQAQMVYFWRRHVDDVHPSDH